MKRIKGMTQQQYWQQLRRSSKEAVRRTPPVRSYKRTSNSKPVVQVEVEDTVLRKWYLQKIQECDWRCDECGANVFSAVELYQFSVQAHLLSKELYPSVKTHPANHAVLGVACGCHYRYDANWMKAQTMKIWPATLHALITVLIPALSPEDYCKLPEFLKDLYESGSYQSPKQLHMEQGVQYRWQDTDYQRMAMSAVHTGRDGKKKLTVTFINGDAVVIELSRLFPHNLDKSIIDAEVTNNGYTLEFSTMNGKAGEVPWDRIRIETDEAFKLFLEEKRAENRKELGLRFKSLREKRGMSIGELASAARVDVMEVVRIEEGNWDETFTMLSTLLTGMGYEMRDLAGEAE